MKFFDATQAEAKSSSSLIWAWSLYFCANHGHHCESPKRECHKSLVLRILRSSEFIRRDTELFEFWIRACSVNILSYLFLFLSPLIGRKILVRFPLLWSILLKVQKKSSWWQSGISRRREVKYFIQICLTFSFSDSNSASAFFDDFTLLPKQIPRNQKFSWVLLVNPRFELISDVFCLWMTLWSMRN